MAIAHDAASGGKGAAWPAASISWSHTCTGSNLVLLIGVVASDDFVGGGTLPTGTYGSQSLTLIASQQPNGSGFEGCAMLFGLVAPATGTNTITITGPGGTQSDWEAGSDSYTGCDQVSGWTNITKAHGSSAAPSGTVASVATGDWVLAVNAFGASAGAPSITSGTQRWTTTENASENGGVGAGGDSGPGSGAGITISWSTSASADWGWIGVELIAAADGSPAVPQQARSRFRQRRSPRQLARQMPWVLSMDAAGAVSGPPVYPLGHPVQARALPQRGGSTSTRTGPYEQLGPPARQWRSPVATAARGLPPRGRAARTAGPYEGTGPAPRQWDAPVAGTGRGLPPRGRAQSRSGPYDGTGPPFPAPHGPVAIRRTLPPRGRSTGRTGAYGQLGPPARQWNAPVQARQLPRRGGTAASRAGTFTATAIVSGPPIYPLGHPVQARRQPARGGSAASRAGTLTPGPAPVYPLHGPVRTRPQPPPRGRIVKAAGPYQGTGAPAIPLQQPVSAWRKQPPLPTRGRVQSLRGPYSGTGPPTIPLRRPVRGQPQKPLLTGRTSSRAGTFTVPPVAPGGTVTIADAATATAVLADQLAQTVTIADAATAAVTVGDFQP